MTMTRDDFEEWLDERKSDALDDVPQGETAPQLWLKRLYTSLKATADEEEQTLDYDGVPSEDEDDDLSSEGDDDEEESL